MNTQPLHTHAPGFARTFPSVSQFLDSAWQAASSGWPGRWLTGQAGSARQLETLRGFVLTSLAVCTGAEPDRLRRRVQRATSIERLLELREALFNGIARARCQTTAGRFLARFDRLAPRRPRPAAPQLRHRMQRHAA